MAASYRAAVAATRGTFAFNGQVAQDTTEGGLCLKAQMYLRFLSLSENSGKHENTKVSAECNVLIWLQSSLALRHAHFKAHISQHAALRVPAPRDSRLSKVSPSTGMSCNQILGMLSKVVIRGMLNMSH